MSLSNDKGIDPVERFHEYLTKPNITLADLEDLLLIAQEIRELELHCRDNRKYIEAFIHDELERMRASSKKKPDTNVCSPEFVESLKFIER